MGIYFEHSVEHNFMLIVLHGAISNEEVNAHIDHLLSGRYNTPGMRGLMVLCENLSAGQLRWRTVFGAGQRMRSAKFRHRGKLAIVARSAVSYGLARIYQTATEATGLDETRVLRAGEVDKAIRWLGIEALSHHITETVQRCEESEMHPSGREHAPAG